jgi:tetratricopeptide (TPR) repeat protein
MYAGEWARALDALVASERTASAHGDRPAQIRALVAISRVRLDEGLNRRADVTLALAPARRALELANAWGDRGLVADALDRIGMVRYWQWALADEATGDSLLLEAEVAFESARAKRNDPAPLAYSHFHLGLVAEGKQDRARAREHFASALAAAAVGADRAIESYALRHLAAYDDDRASAERRLRRSLALRRDLGWKTGTASAMDALAKHLAGAGHVDEARTLLRDAIALAREAQSPYYVTRVAETLASLEERVGNVAAAVAILEETSRDISQLTAEPLRREHAMRLLRLQR